MYPTSDKQLNYETDDTVYFFSGPFDPLNNWSAHAVALDGRRFLTLEHGFHFLKFVDTAPDVAQEIYNAPSPWAAMQIERQNKSNRRTDWQEIKVDIMKELFRAKAQQNPDVAECLLATGNKRVVENSPWDAFWGCGEDGAGLNMMGKILEEIRAELRASERK